MPTPDDELASPDSTPRAPGRSRTANNGGDGNLDSPGEMGIRDIDDDEGAEPSHPE